MQRKIDGVKGFIHLYPIQLVKVDKNKHLHNVTRLFCEVKWKHCSIMYLNATGWPRLVKLYF